MQQQGWKPTRALVPVMKMVGPTFPPPHSEEADEMKAKWAARICSVNYTLGLQGYSTGQIEEKQDHDVGPSFILDSPEGRIAGHAGCAQQRGPSFFAAQLTCRTYFFLHFSVVIEGSWMFIGKLKTE